MPSMRGNNSILQWRVAVWPRLMLIMWIIRPCQDKEDSLPAFLEQLKSESEALGVTDLHVALTSLEEVFLNIARQAEIDAEGGGGTREVELDDGHVLQVALGVQEAQHPVTGKRYSI
eukprot:scaffold390597_cov45-Prasinocladus_malaysianus.AAC.1